MVALDGAVEVHMRETNAFAWYMESDPLLRSTVVVVLVLDSMPDWDRLTARLERFTRQAPAFRQKVVHPPLRLATPRWVVDPHFDLSWHLRRFEAPSPKTLATVLDFAHKTGMAGLDRDRPLWEATFVEGLEDGRTAAVLKLHHSLTDGVGGMQMARLLFDLEPEPGDPGPVPDPPPAEDLDALDLARDALGHGLSRAVASSRAALGAAPGEAVQAVLHPRRTLGEAVATVQAVARFLQPVPQTMSPLMTQRRAAWHYDVLRFPLADALDAAHAAGAKLNDAFLSGITAGLRRYHEHHGSSVDELRVTMPVSIRGPHDAAGGNRITLLRFQLPAALEDPVERMRETRDRCAPMKSDRSLPLTDLLAGALNLLPRAYVAGMLKHMDFLASNVPGTPVPLHLAGSTVEGFYAFGPTVGAALNTTLTSYRGDCFVGVTIDTGAVPDPEVLMECMRDGFDEVLAVAGAVAPVHLPGRTAS